jgi:periplasmic divalent cation tolerance protein
MFVYATAGDAIEARRIARIVVEERLAACGNVIGGISSVYWWNGAVREATEAVLILKTTADRLDPLIARVKALHSYDCPCIEALPVTAGNPAFLDWISAETQPGSAE